MPNFRADRKIKKHFCFIFKKVSACKILFYFLFSTDRLHQKGSRKIRQPTNQLTMALLISVVIYSMTSHTLKNVIMPLSVSLDSSWSSLAKYLQTLLHCSVQQASRNSSVSLDMSDEF